MRSLLRRVLDSADAAQQRHVWLSFPVAVLRKFSDDGGGSLAALVAHYGLLAVFPLLLVFAAVLEIVLAGDASIKNQVLRTTEQSFPALATYIRETVSTSNAALGVGLAGALWAGLGVTRATERAMNTIWDIPLAERPNVWWSRVRGVAMLGILGVTFLVSTGLASLRGTGVLAVPTDAVAVAGSLALNVALYMLAFVVLTNRHLAWRSVLPGSLVGAVGWTILQSLGAFYVRHGVAHASQLYGSLAWVIGLLLWIYLGGQLTLVAAEVNVVLAYRLWPRSIAGRTVTDADRRALRRQAQEAGHFSGETITVSFSGNAVEVHGGGHAGPVQGLSAQALTTHAHVVEAVTHLHAFDACRHLVDVSEDPSARPGLRARLRSEAAEAAAALERLAQEDAEMSDALTHRPG